jgi:two-component system NarL family response regulator
MPINVLISGGRKLVREGLSALLEKHSDIRVVGEADDSRGAIKLIDALDAHVVLLLSQTSGSPTESRAAAQVIRSIVDAHPKVKVIIVSYGLTPPELRRLMSAGAIGCVTMESASIEVITAIRGALTEKVYLSEQLVAQVTKFVTTQKRAEPVLAPREIDVLRQYAEGKSTKEIARAMHIGVKTVETHRRRLMQKLDRHSIAELTQYAIAKGLVDLPHAV